MLTFPASVVRKVEGDAATFRRAADAFNAPVVSDVPFVAALLARLAALRIAVVWLAGLIVLNRRRLRDLTYTNHICLATGDGQEEDQR